MRLDVSLDHPGLKLALAPLLLPASALYAVGLAADRWMSGARRKELPVPTISVGNLTVGGTGKTPVLLRLASDLKALGRRPFVLTRGYAGPGRRTRSGVVRSAADASGFSDEVRLMADVLPGVAIAAGGDRVSGARQILSSGNENVALLDDGFQHWGLRRDLDVVCVDATDPWGGGFLLPMGRLREPRSGLKRAGLVLLTRCERIPVERAEAIAAHAQALAPDATVLRTRFLLRLVTPDGRPAPAPKRAFALSAVGNPRSFEANLTALGIHVVPVRYGDHHAYTGDEWADIGSRARAGTAPIVTTAKDWVKLRALVSTGDPDVLIAVQSLSFDDDGAEVWANRLRCALERT